MEIKFIVKKDKEVIISVVDDDINAFYNGKKIGEITFDFIEKEFGCGNYGEYIPRLFYMQVDSDFREVGIASKMMKLAVEHHGHFLRPTLNSVGERGKECYEYYTPEGKALIESCIRNGILEDDPDEGFEE